jgi:peptidoglycan/LPS O-acetylase OafA/YrhL
VRDGSAAAEQAPIPISESAHPTYRPDIDGLRAVAVLSVVGFHAFPEWVRGGFVGVDVFFVISGFLISSILFNDLHQGRFTFISFFARRIRRIFPALIIVLVATFAFGWFALIPSEYKQLGQHIFGGSAFIANILFWRESGYFDVSAELKPLLHLWSLGIEEQFYILWPLTLFIAHKRRANLLSLVFSIALISFALNIAHVYNDGVATFYSPHTRFWELLLGGALACLMRHKNPTADTPLARRRFMFTGRLSIEDAKSIGGFLLIVVAIFLLDKEKAFPGWYGLLPTLGALLIISAGPDARLNRTVLAHRALVFIGLISYPLYLWHWPLLSFARIIASDTPPPEVRMALVLASLLLAVLTYRFIERPIRTSRRMDVAVVLSLLLVIVATVGYNAYRRDGLPFRMKHLVTTLSDLSSFGSYRTAYTKCAAPGMSEFSWCMSSKPGPIDYALWGDSHADHLFPGIAESDKAHNWLLIGQSSCPPLANMRVYKIGERDICHERNKAALDFILQDRNISRVLLASAGPFYISDIGFAPAHQGRNDPKLWTIEPVESSRGKKDEERLFYDGLAETVRLLQRAGKRVDVYVDVPELPFEPADCVFKRPFSSRLVPCEIKKEVVLSRQKEYREILLKLRDTVPGVRLFDPLDFLCDQRLCQIRAGSNLLYYRDSHHLSLRGSALLAGPFIAWRDATVDRSFDRRRFIGDVGK